MTVLEGENQYYKEKGGSESQGGPDCTGDSLNKVEAPPECSFYCALTCTMNRQIDRQVMKKKQFKLSWFTCDNTSL